MLNTCKSSFEQGMHKGNIMYQVIGYYTQSAVIFLSNVPEWQSAALPTSFLASYVNWISLLAPWLSSAQILTGADF